LIPIIRRVIADEDDVGTVIDRMLGWRIVEGVG
jgi:hypothetical protein